VSIVPTAPNPDKESLSGVKTMEVEVGKLYLERGNSPSTGTAPPQNRMIVIIAPQSGVGFYLIG
jgi:hypothetical protein